MKMRLLLTTLTSLCFSTMFAQSVLPNSSFESGSDGSPGSFNSGLTDLDDWKNFGTSDWIHSGDNATGTGSWSTFPAANSGNAYIGYGACEGAQVEIDYPSTNNDGYYLLKPSFYYRPVNSFYANEINLFLLEDEYSGGLVCESFENFDIGYEITEEVPNPDPTQWTQFQTNYAFLTGNEDKPTHLAFRGLAESGAYGADNYMLIDDVVLEAIDPCSLACGSDDGAITSMVQDQNGNPIYYNDPIDGLHWNPVSGTTPKVTCYGDYWSLITLVDANWVKLTVQDRWGNAAIYEYFDPTGLHDANYQASSLPTPYQNWPSNAPSNHFTVFWDGIINGGYAGVDTYIAKIESSNCIDKLIGQSAIYFEIVIVDDKTYEATPIYNVPQIIDVTTCDGVNSGRFCEPTEITEIPAQQQQTGVGEYGNTIIFDLTSQWDIEGRNFAIASEYIEIQGSMDIVPNVEEPGHLDLLINSQISCPEGKNGLTSNTSSEADNFGFKRSHRDNLIVTDNNVNDVIAFPNPVRSGNQLTINSDKIQSAELITTQGQVLYRYSTFEIHNENSQTKLLIPDNVQGMIILKLQDDEEVYTYSISVL